MREAKKLLDSLLARKWAVNRYDNESMEATDLKTIKAFIRTVEAKAYETATAIAKAYSGGLSDEDIPDDKSEAYVKGLEDAQIDIVQAIRLHAKSLPERQ